MQKRYGAALHKRAEASRNKKHWGDKLFAEQEDLKKKQMAAEGVQNEFEVCYIMMIVLLPSTQIFKVWSEKAEQVGERVEKPRKPEAIKRLVESVERALQQHEKQYASCLTIPNQLTVDV
jgi:hypothetical protein